MALTTTANWKTWRGITSTAYDAVVDELVDDVTDEINRYVGNRIESETYTDLAVDGDGSQRMVLPYWPVTALTAVKEQSDTGTTTTLDTSSYRCVTGDRNRGVVARLPFRPGVAGSTPYVDSWGTYDFTGRPVWHEGVGNYLFTFTAGYATVPGDIEKAAWHLIDAYLDRKGMRIFDQAVAEGNQNRTARSAEDAKAEYHRLLAPFRREP